MSICWLGLGIPEGLSRNCTPLDEHPLIDEEREGMNLDDIAAAAELPAEDFTVLGTVCVLLLGIL